MSFKYTPGVLALCLFFIPSQLIAFTVLKAPNGQPLRWEHPTIPFYIGPLSDDAPEDEQIDAIIESAYTWEEAAEGRLTIEFMGFTDINYEERKDENVIFAVQSGWVFSDSAVAITRTWGLSSGEIEGFDMHLNDEISNFSTEDEPPQGRTDLQNTVTHEFGHALGLDHSNDPAACMYSTAIRGETSKRSLSEDDIAALNWLYSSGPYAQGWHCSTSRTNGLAFGPLALMLAMIFRLRRKGQPLAQEA